MVFIFLRKAQFGVVVNKHQEERAFRPITERPSAGRATGPARRGPTLTEGLQGHWLPLQILDDIDKNDIRSFAWENLGS